MACAGILPRHTNWLSSQALLIYGFHPILRWKSRHIPGAQSFKLGARPFSGLPTALPARMAACMPWVPYIGLGPQPPHTLSQPHCVPSALTPRALPAHQQARAPTGSWATCQPCWQVELQSQLALALPPIMLLAPAVPWP